MRTAAFIAAAAIGVLAVPAAKADIWTWTDWGAGFGSYHFDPGQPRGGPSVVAGWGDDGTDGQRRYWGGPFWVERRGNHPPFETYPDCSTVLVAKADDSGRRVRHCR